VFHRLGFRTGVDFEKVIKEVVLILCRALWFPSRREESVKVILELILIKSLLRRFGFSEPCLDCLSTNICCSVWCVCMCAEKT